MATRDSTALQTLGLSGRRPALGLLLGLGLGALSVTPVGPLACSESCVGRKRPCQCGTDDICRPSEDPRVRIVDPAELWPESAVGSLGGCTGTLVGPRHVLTAAHCVASGFDGERFTWTPTFAAARDGDDLPYGKVPVQRVFVPEGYLEGACGWSSRARPVEWDFALLELRWSLPIAPLPYRALDDETLAAATIYNRGYPSDGACAPEEREPASMWGSEGRLSPDRSLDREGLIYTSTVGSPGHSGSSLYTVDPQTREMTIVGVYVGPYCGECEWPTSTSVRLGAITVEHLNAWIAEAEDRPCCEAWVELDEGS